MTVQQHRSGWRARAACLAEARERGEPYGIRGGLTPNERCVLRQEVRA